MSESDDKKTETPTADADAPPGDDAPVKALPAGETALVKVDADDDAPATEPQAPPRGPPKVELVIRGQNEVKAPSRGFSGAFATGLFGAICFAVVAGLVGGRFVSWSAKPLNDEASDGCATAAAVAVNAAIDNVLVMQLAAAAVGFVFLFAIGLYRRAQP